MESQEFRGIVEFLQWRFVSEVDIARAKKLCGFLLLYWPREREFTAEAFDEIANTSRPLPAQHVATLRRLLPPAELARALALSIIQPAP